MSCIQNLNFPCRNVVYINFLKEVIKAALVNFVIVFEIIFRYVGVSSVGFNCETKTYHDLVLFFTTVYWNRVAFCSFLVDSICLMQIERQGMGKRKDTLLQRDALLSC